MSGMGIGAFVDGMVRGYGLQQQALEREEARKDREADRQWRREQQEWMREDRDYQRSERERIENDRREIEQIHSDSRDRYEQERSSGQFTEDFETWFRQDTLPRLTDEYLSRGDVKGAKDLMDWADSADAKKGGKLFAEALFLSQSGQHDKALDKVIEAGRMRGYISNDFDIDEKEEIHNTDGQTIGYRITMRDSEGNETIQDIALDDIPSVIATFANPVAAWESQQASRANKAEREAELEDYERKKQIDAKYRDDGNKQREAAIKSLRDRHKVDPLVEGSKNFDDYSRDERERMISEEISFLTGQASQPTPPNRQVIMDSSTGRPLPRPGDPAWQNATGLGNVPGQPVQRPGEAAPLGAPVRGNAVINGREDPGLPAPPTPSELVDQAAQQLVSGADPQEVARTLRATGVDESSWPPELHRLISAGATPSR